VPELRIEVREALVGQQQRRIVTHERAGDSDPLLLACAELVGTAVLEFYESDKTARFEHARLKPMRWYRSYPQRIGDVLEDAQVRIEA
jgi:hypothetical protein